MVWGSCKASAWVLFRVSRFRSLGGSWWGFGLGVVVGRGFMADGIYGFCWD